MFWGMKLQTAQATHIMRPNTAVSIMQDFARRDHYFIFQACNFKTKSLLQGPGV